MSHLLHLTQDEYADVLLLSSRIGLDVMPGTFDAYVMRNFGAQPFTENVVHVVRLIPRNPDGEHMWKWCDRCSRFVNISDFETWGREAHIETLSAQLRANA